MLFVKRALTQTNFDVSRSKDENQEEEEEDKKKTSSIFKVSKAYSSNPKWTVLRVSHT